MSFWASLKNPFSNLQLFLSSMVLPPRPPKFLTFHGKSYDPSIEWIDEEGLLQDPLNHAPYPIHQRPQGEFIAFCFCWLICQFFFFFFLAWYLRNLWWALSFCCYLLCGNLECGMFWMKNFVCRHVDLIFFFWVFLNCWVVWIYQVWTMLMICGTLHCM